MASKARAITSRTFLIRRAKSLYDLQWVMKLATEEGCNPRKKEAECYFSAGLTPYFYIGELKGKQIGCVLLVRHTETTAFWGSLFVAKAYRKQGYGMELFDFAEALVDQRDLRMMAVKKPLFPTY